MMRRLPALIMTGAAALALAGCSADSAPDSTRGADLVPTAPASVTFADVDTAANAPVRDAVFLDGSELSLDQLWNGRAAVLQFTASWCDRCAEAEPELNELATEYGDALTVARINVDEPVDDITAYFDEHDVTGPVIVDRGRELARAYAVSEQPVTVLVAPSGGIVRMWPSGASRADLDADLASLIKE